MKNFKNKLVIFLVFGFFISVSSATCSEVCEKILDKECNTVQEQKQIQDSAKNDINKKTCEKCKVEDDEYCIYNQCYFDKQYRALKEKLSPDFAQENCLDNIYLNFKQDLEIQCERYSKEKNKLLELIVSDKKRLKEQKRVVKDISNDIKEKYKDYLSDTNTVLVKSQKKTFRKFKRRQNRKIKQIKKYGAIYKFPCS